MFIGLIKKLIRPLLVRIAREIKTVENKLTIEKFSEKGLLEIGEHTYGEFEIDVYKGSEAEIKIGRFCSISKDVRFITGGVHPLNWISSFPFRIKWGIKGAYLDGMPSTRGPIIIENDVWIGTGATILSGVTIGNGAVILAGALVTNNVAAYTIVGGVPAKNVRQRFSDEEIAALEKIKWWTWSEHKLKQNINLLSSGDIALFIDKNRIKD